MNFAGWASPPVHTKETALWLADATVSADGALDAAAAPRCSAGAA
jgi:hypothetical protein